MEDRYVTRGRDLEHRAPAERTAGSRGAVEISVGGLNQFVRTSGLPTRERMESTSY